jgi:inner membrane protein
MTTADVAQQSNPRRSWRSRLGLDSPGFDFTKRAIFLGLLTLLLLVPLGMIDDLIYERAARKDQVAAEITAQWGGAQTITGPILVVPYKYFDAKSADSQNGLKTGQLYFLPEKLDIDAKLKTEKRARSIYEVLVYGGAVQLRGRFAPLDATRWDIAPENIAWQDAKLLIGLTDMAAIRDLAVSVGGAKYTAEAGLQDREGLGARVLVHLALNPATAAQPHDFAIDLAFKGSGSIAFILLGDATRITLAADWPHPGFIGATLPESREIGGKDFKAVWSLGYLARAFPRSWRSGELSFDTLWRQSIGVELVEPGNVHQQTDRIVKYGVLVIALTFATIFVNGLMTSRRVHPVQYLLVGASICLFYLLLLSLAEQFTFGTSYLVASLADIGLVGWYAWRTMSHRLGYLTAAILGLVHLYMYVLLQMEDYTLLSGTLALFAALLATMAATRNIDWYRMGRASAPHQG